MTPDPTPWLHEDGTRYADRDLTEQIAEELYYEEHPEGRHRNDWRSEHPLTRIEFMDRAAAVLPIVKAAQAEALRDAATDMGEWGKEALIVTGDEGDEDTWVEQSMTEWLAHRADQIEKEHT